jgi:hypothetical protein
MTDFKILTDAQPTLKEAQDFVGGYVQMVTLNNGDQLLMDEDGGHKSGLAFNEEAVAHAQEHGSRVLLDRLVGPVLCLRHTARWT